jgi:hypothetical protein
LSVRPVRATIESSSGALLVVDAVVELRGLRAAVVRLAVRLRGVVFLVVAICYSSQETL